MPTNFPLVFKLVWVCLRVSVLSFLISCYLYSDSWDSWLSTGWFALTLLRKALAPGVSAWASFHNNMRWISLISSALGADRVKCPNSNSSTYAKEKPHSNLVCISKAQKLHVLANDHMWDVPFSFFCQLSCLLILSFICRVAVVWSSFSLFKTIITGII